VKAGSIGYEPEQHPTLRAGSNLASTGAVIALQSDGSSSNGAQHGSGWNADGSAYTVNTRDRQSVCIAANQRGEVRLDGTDRQTVGAIPATRSGKQSQGVLTPWDVQSKRVYSQDACRPTLPSDYKGVGNEYVSEGKVVANAQAGGAGPRYVVRRLTSVECERLQGFPDGWTDVPDFDGKPMSDAQRYKQLGNSMAVPVMRWIGKRILMVDEEEGSNDAD
jgi:DNA (cytosine-5)-methyltransferase 1